jgi:hypothetical protein
VRWENGPPAPAGIPPLVTWLLVGGAPESHLLSALDHLANAYRHEALRTMQWLSVYLPLLLTALVGGGVVLAYGLVVFWPLSYFLNQLSQP